MLQTDNKQCMHVYLLNYNYISEKLRFFLNIQTFPNQIREENKLTSKAQMRCSCWKER